MNTKCHVKCINKENVAYCTYNVTKFVRVLRVTSESNPYLFNWLFILILFMCRILLRVRSGRGVYICTFGKHAAILSTINLVRGEEEEEMWDRGGVGVGGKG